VVHAEVWRTKTARRFPPSRRASWIAGSSPAMTHKEPFSQHVSRARALPTTKRLDSPPGQKGGEAPKGACRPWAARRRHCARELARLARRAAARHIGARRLPALRPRLLQRFPSLLNSRPCFLGLGIERALPALSGPSPVTAPHASAVVPKGLMPEAAPARIASPRGSTALAPHHGSHPECVPYRARFGDRSNWKRGKCQAAVA
jgi:hypothetical protein